MIDHFNNLHAPRSVLFVPGHREDMITKAVDKGHDAVCLDLEDSVPLEVKDKAREIVGHWVDKLQQKSNVRVSVRINSEVELCGEDLKVVSDHNVDFLLLPKVLGGQHIEMVGDALDRLAPESCAAGIVAMVEDPKALETLSRHDHFNKHLCGFAFGSEDFAAVVGAEPSSTLLSSPFARIAGIAKSAGLWMLGYPGTIAEYRDLALLKSMAEHGKALGADGALAIHPAQIAVFNDVFSPSDEEIHWAKRIVSLFMDAKASGLGATSLDGRMIDKPVVLRAQSIMARASSDSKMSEGHPSKR